MFHACWGKRSYIPALGPSNVGHERPCLHQVAPTLQEMLAYVDELAWQVLVWCSPSLAFVHQVSASTTYALLALPQGTLK